MVKPLFGTDQPKQEKKPEVTVGKINFVDRPISKQNPEVGKLVFAPSTSQSIPVVPQLVQLACDKIKAIDNNLYKKNSSYCQTQLQMLLPIKIDVVLQWGGKTMEKMVACSRDVNNLIDSITQTNCNSVIDDLTKKLNPSSNKLVNMFKTKLIDVNACKASITAIGTILSSVLPSCDPLIEEMQLHYTQITLKLVILTAMCDVVGTISDPTLDSTIYKRKLTLQQGATQAQMLIQQLKDTKSFIVSQKQLIDHLLTVTIPAFNSIKR